MKTLQRLFASLTVLAAIAIAIPSHAAEQDSQKISKPKFSNLELRENLGNTPILPTSKADETITFTVNVDSKGSVKSMTYTHNVRSESESTIQSYIRDAYRAIMETTFQPAMQDGKPVDASVTIQFMINN